MKKLFVLIIALLTGISFSFAQYQVKVSWDASDPNCSCGTGIEEVFKINVLIYDVANDEYLPAYNATANGNETEKIIDVDDVEYYCSESHENTPSFTIRVSVVLHCNANPPFDACSGDGQKSSVSCNDFADVTPVEVIVGILN